MKGARVHRFSTSKSFRTTWKPIWSTLKRFAVLEISLKCFYPIRKHRIFWEPTDACWIICASLCSFQTLIPVSNGHCKSSHGSKWVLGGIQERAATTGTAATVELFHRRKTKKRKRRRRKTCFFGVQTDPVCCCWRKSSPFETVINVWKLQSEAQMIQHASVGSQKIRCFLIG